MFDHVHLGWLECDDYRVAARAAGVVELPGGPEPGRDAPGTQNRVDPPPRPPAGPTAPGEPARSVLDDLLGGRWDDGDPGSVGR